MLQRLVWVFCLVLATAFPVHAQTVVYSQRSLAGSTATVPGLFDQLGLNAGNGSVRRDFYEIFRNNTDTAVALDQAVILGRVNIPSTAVIVGLTTGSFEFLPILFPNPSDIRAMATVPVSSSISGPDCFTSTSGFTGCPITISFTPKVTIPAGGQLAFGFIVPDSTTTDAFLFGTDTIQNSISSGTPPYWTGFYFTDAFGVFRAGAAGNHYLVITGTPIGIDDVTSNHNVIRVDPAIERYVASPVALAVGASGARRQGSTVLTQTTTCTGSSVDNLRFSYMQESIDYQTMVQPQVEVDAGCRAALRTGKGGLPELMIHRYHRPRETAVWSSFGPGVFSNFDTKIQLVAQGVGNQPNVILFDADSDIPPLTFFELSPEDGDQTIDGVYHETATRAWKTLEIRNAKGVRTSNQSDAVTAVLTAHTGERRVFEVVRTLPADMPLLDGRLIRIEDRNHNAVVVSYVYGAHASSDRSRLWQIQTVKDAYGVSARFHYADVLVGGRWVVDRIDLPNRGQLQYRYRQPQELPRQVNQGPLLKEVIHPDGTRSHFTLRFDAETQLVVLGFDDSAEGPSQARKEVFITPSQALLNGNIVKQTPNLVRRVVNGDGELVYRNWEDPADSHIIYFYEGGVLHRLTTREDGFPVAYARAVSYHVGQDPRSATFESIETYDANSRQMLTARRDAFGRVQQLKRNDASRAVEGLTLPDASTVQATYNAFRQPLQVTDRLGRIAKKTYDARGNLLSDTLAFGTKAEATSLLVYNPRGQVTQSTDANGNTTAYNYDATGRFIAQIEPADKPGKPRATTTFAYDRAGRLMSRSDAEGRTIRFDYDLRNRLTAIHYPDGSEEQFRFGQDQDANLLTSHTDRNGNEERFAYDRTKRLAGKIMAFGKPEAVGEQITYVPGTSLASTTVQRGEQTDYERDGRNRLTTTVVHVSGNRTLRTSAIYDILDRVIQNTDPYGRSKFFVYDDNDRLIRSVIELVPGSVSNGANPATLPRDESLNPGYVIEDTVLDSMGQVMDSINGRGIATHFAYDGQGRRIEQVEAADTEVAARTVREYDPRGNLIRVTHPRTFTEGKPFVTTYAYTARNLQQAVTVGAGTSDEGTTTTRYTLTGQRAEETDARGKRTTYRYDTCCDRLIEMKDPTGAVTRYSYDPYGNRLSMVDANKNSARFDYDGLHRLTAQTNAENETTRFDYDDDLTDGQGLDARFRGVISKLGFRVWCGWYGHTRHQPAARDDTDSCRQLGPHGTSSRRQRQYHDH